MSLAETLDAMRNRFEGRVPAEKRAVMHRVTEDLRASGALSRVIKTGTPLPAFMLRNSHGQEVRSPNLLAKGAVVLTVFRGSW